MSSGKYIFFASPGFSIKGDFTVTLTGSGRITIPKVHLSSCSAEVRVRLLSHYQRLAIISSVLTSSFSKLNNYGWALGHRSVGFFDRSPTWSLDNPHPEPRQCELSFGSSESWSGPAMTGTREPPQCHLLCMNPQIHSSQRCLNLEEQKSARDSRKKPELHFRCLRQL